MFNLSLSAESAYLVERVFAGVESKKSWSHRGGTSDDGDNATTDESKQQARTSKRAREAARKQYTIDHTLSYLLPASGQGGSALRYLHHIALDIDFQT